MKKLFDRVLEKLKTIYKEFGTRKLVLLLVFIFLISCIYTYFQYVEREYISHITLTLNYANGKNGLTPTGARFNISEIKSDEVIKDALKKLNDSSLTVEAVRDRIHINPKTPASTFDNVASAVAGGTKYSYCPSEFMIYYSQKNKFAKNNTNAFLTALVASYKEYFYKNHVSKNVILEFDIADSLERYDYNEQHQVIYDKIASMLSYLNQRQLENDSFRSKTTGYTFGNLISLLGNVDDVDLVKLNANITQNGITKNKKLFFNKQQYSIDKKMLQYNILYQGSQIAKDAMEEYDEHLTSVAFIPTVDKQNEFYMARTKTGIDNLATQSYNDGLSAVEKKKDIDKYQYLIEQFGESGETPEEQSKNVEKEIKSICKNLQEISRMAIMTDNDYIKEKYDNYITFYYNNTHYKSYLIIFLKTIVILVILMLILIVLLDRLKKRVAYRRLLNATKHFIKKDER